MLYSPVFKIPYGPSHFSPTFFVVNSRLLKHGMAFCKTASMMRRHQNSIRYPTKNSCALLARVAKRGIVELQRGGGGAGV